ncbi:MAG: hypothetical protein ACD_56C00074G0004 [uncultured bacterium]|nr:MAG: hypothetical protein ACD_56C00074G0004 [uncultured bacterium]
MWDFLKRLNLALFLLEYFLLIDGKWSKIEM